MPRPRTALSIASLASAALLATASPAAGASTHDWTRFGFSASRPSASPYPTGIASVRSLARRRVALDGTVDSSPIYLHGVRVGGAPHDALFVTTTYGRTEALDAASGAVLWRYTPSGYASWARSAQITTATPVADPARDAIYAATPGGTIVKLAVADGHPLWSVAVTRLPQREKIAAALNFDRGHVIATTGGYLGDAPPYQGHVAVIDAASGRLLRVWNSLCSDRHALLAPSSCPASDSAIWGRAGAVVDPASGQLLVATGNGPFDGRTSWGDSVLRLDPLATRLLRHWTPPDAAALAASDRDLGSTSPTLLPGGWLVQGGKDGRIRLLTPRLRQAQVVSTPSGAALFTAPAVWRSFVFVADDGGTAAYRFVRGRLSLVWRAAAGGTSPVVAGGLLWVYDPAGGLNVYAAASGRRVATLACGAGHWNSPIVVDGVVALPEGDANDHAERGVLDLWR